jgi:hypothetical protein
MKGIRTMILSNFVRRIAAAGILCALGWSASAQPVPSYDHSLNTIPSVTSWCLNGSTLVICPAGGGGGGSNAAAGTTGTAPPGSASYTGFLSSGNLVGVSAGNPLPITGSISATNPSVGSTGSTAPSSATLLGLISGSNLVGLSAANPMPIGPLPAGTNAVGSISNTSFGISGTLPAFGATPTVNLGTLGGAATAAAQTGVQTTIAPGTAPASGTVGGCVYNATQPSPTSGQSLATNCDSFGSARVALEATTGTGMNSVRAVNTAASNMAFRVAVSPRTLYGYTVCNSNASAVYFRIYNAAANPPVPGTTVPMITEYVAPTSCRSVMTDVGVFINNYIGYAVTSGSLADTDTSTVATANTVSLTVFYQ